MENTPDLSLVIPLLNESKNVERVTTDMINAFERDGVTLQVVLVNNGSTDDTGAIIDRMSAEYHSLRTVHLKENQGYGGGILEGMAQGDGAHVGYTCGDGQISAEDHVAVFRKLSEGGYDICRVVRTVRGDGPWRVLITSVYHFFFPLFFGIRAKDINAHPKMYRRSSFEKLAISHRDWFIDAEALMKAHRLGYRVAEVPARFEARQHGRSNIRLKTIFEFAANMVKYRLGGIEKLFPAGEPGKAQFS